MIKIQTVIKDEAGQVQGGIDFYWTKGEQTVLYQSWDHGASGRDWKQVACDPMSGDDFVDYLHNCWEGFTIVDVEEDHG